MGPHGSEGVPDFVAGDGDVQVGEGWEGLVGSDVLPFVRALTVAGDVRGEATVVAAPDFQDLG